MLSTADVSVPDVLRYFTSKGIEVAFLVPTSTGMKKSIMDATASVRAFLKKSNIHDFDVQTQGPENKKIIETVVVNRDGLYNTKTSLYRPCTKQGDPRIWVGGLARFAEAGNLLALLATSDGRLLVVNASNANLIPGVVSQKHSYLEIRDTDRVNLDDILAKYIRRDTAAADELLGMMRKLANIWHPGNPGNRRDFEVGRLLEELLGIRPNNLQIPDYKGIEIKASRRKLGNRQTLFAKTPDWDISFLKSSAEILDAFGYTRNPKYTRQLRCTVSSERPNSQGLFLNVENRKGLLFEKSTLTEIPEVVCWKMENLKERLRSKHPETFWVSASSKKEGNRESFKYEHVLHTRNPMESALPTLLETGIVTVDHLIARESAGRTTEKGPLFKIAKKNMDLLFPPGALHVL